MVCTDQALAGLLGLEQPQYQQQQQYETETSESVRLGPALPLLERDASGQLLGFTWSDDSGDVRAPWAAASDPSPGGLCYLATGGCLLQLDARNTVQVGLCIKHWRGLRPGPGATRTGTCHQHAYGHSAHTHPAYLSVAFGGIISSLAPLGSPDIEPLTTTTLHTDFALNALPLLTANSLCHSLLQLIAGSWEGTGHRDGPGTSARFERPFFLTPDGEGTLFLIDGRSSRIRRVTLAPTPPAPTQPLPPGHTVAAVHTLHSAALQDGPFSALAMDTATGALMVATPNAVYRIPDPFVQPPPGPSGGGGAAGYAGVVHVAVQAELVAGCDGAAGGADAPSGLDARFGRITDMVLDSNGSLYIADVEAGGGGGGGRYGSGGGGGGGAVIRRLDCRRGFAVSTLPAPLGPLEPVGLSILPGGVLCAYERGGNRVRLVPLGVRPQQPTGLRAQRAAAAAAAATATPPVTSTTGAPSDDGGLGADWLGLLTSPWEPCDVTLVGAGGGSVRAHRLVLGTRSAWLRHRLARNPNAYEVALPEAAPAALEVAVRHMYGGGVELPAGDPLLAAGVLALSEKLQLGRLAEAARRALQQQQQQGQQAHTAAGTMPQQQQQQYPQQQYQPGYQPQQQQQQYQYQYPSTEQPQQRPQQYESGASASPGPSSSHGGGSFHPPHDTATGASPASAAAAAAAAVPGGGYAPSAPGAGEAELPSAPSAPPAPPEAPRPSTPGAWSSEPYPPYPYPQQQQQQQPGEGIALNSACGPVGEVTRLI